MSTGNLSAEFVGGPANRYRCAIRGVVLHGALDQLSFGRRAGILSTSGLRLHDTTLGLVRERVVATIVAQIPVLAYDLFRLPEIFLAVSRCDKDEEDLKDDVGCDFKRKIWGIIVEISLVR